MKKHPITYKSFLPQISTVGEREGEYGRPVSVLESGNSRHVWSPGMDRISVLKSGVPYSAIEVVAKRMQRPVKEVLAIFELAQTTYNKKLREGALLGSRDTEMLLLLTELIDFGIMVFNGEEGKFLRWMKKPNASLGGSNPEGLLDSFTGIQEVKNSLNRLEHGNLA